MSKYSVRQDQVQTLLSWVKSGQIAIPEMQRPFVWNSQKVRDLLDSLYNGYPVGYLITWQSQDVGLKDGTTSGFRQILIDGQQRITAMAAALVGDEVVDKDYSKKRIKIAFNPQTEEFATLTPVLRRDPAWISDVSEFMNAGSTYKAIKAYVDENAEADTDGVEEAFERLAGIQQAQVGIITLAAELDINTVTEIFIRINSKGVPLSSADFAMSKIASHGEYGSNLRKLIDYFCHLVRHPQIYDDIVAHDRRFVDAGLMDKIAWVKNDAPDLYNVNYTDIIRVAGLRGFGRGKIAPLVSLLSGRDFETRSFSEELAVQSFEDLEKALGDIVNEYNFRQFIMTIKSAGFTREKLIGSKNALNFAYALFLRLRSEKQLSDGRIKSVVRRWFVMSMLTSRHSGSFESQFEQDIRRIDELGAEEYLTEVERGQLTDGYWDVELPSRMATPSSRSPYLAVFLAAQIHRNAKGFLSKHITVGQMMDDGGDIHHLVPKNYLVKSGVRDQSWYNQIANYALTETPVNIGIKDAAPAAYLARVDEQIASGESALGEISSTEELEASFAENAVPQSLRTTTAETYTEFLQQRRALMAEYIRDYYQSL